MKVLIISPQHWGKMRVTKHHYAIELAKSGHNVFFLEPSKAGWSWNKTRLSYTHTDSPGVTIVHQDINVPYNIKFHLKQVYNWFIRFHIQKIEQQAGPFDLIWSFDLGDLTPLRYFENSAKKLFFAADWPLHEDALKAAEGANILVSVAQEILNQYPDNPKTKKILINHSVADCFLEAGSQPLKRKENQIRIGMSGNFLRPDIDRSVLLEIIREHQDILFECFGAYNSIDSNLGGATDTGTFYFINSLKNAPNVILHGVVTPETLSEELRRMDAFLICYDVAKDQSKGTNYHKVTEYMAYNKPIFSNYFSHANARKINCAKPGNNLDLIKFIHLWKNTLHLQEPVLYKVESYNTQLRHILSHL
jgi:hypothetical protein